MEKLIAELELKISAQNVISNPTPEQSASVPSAMRIIQSALCADGIFVPIDVKREQLESALTLDGPGSEQNPMEIDFESSEDVLMSEPQQSHSTDFAPVLEHRNGGIHNMGMQTGLQTVELTNKSNSVRDHDMACSIEATGSKAAPGINATAIKSADNGDYTNMNTAPGSKAIYSQAQGQAAGANTAAFPPRVPDDDMGANIPALLPHVPDDVQDKGALTSRGPEALAPSVNNGQTFIAAWQEGDEDILAGINSALHDELALNGLVDDEGFAKNWVWDPKCDIDEQVYSFQVRKYNPGNGINETVTIFDSEAPQTYLRLQEWESQRAVLVHYEQQLEELKLKQRSLFRSLSRGFNGNIQHTIAHVTAITRASQDIEVIEGVIRDQLNHTKAKRHDYLATLIEVDQRVLMEARKSHKAAYERLANINPSEIEGIQTEQGLIRLSKERIDLLERDIENRANEMIELAAVAQRFRDEGSECFSEGTVVVKSGGGKGKKRLKEQSPASGSIDERAVPKHRLFPSDPAVAAVEYQLRMTDDIDEDAEDALKSLEKYLKSNPEDPKLFRCKFRKQAHEQVKFFPDASFASINVSKLIFQSSQKQVLCEYHRKGKGSTFKADMPIELFGMGFKGESVGDSSQVGEAQEGHLHCGCPIREVAMEFFLWKTTCAFSSNPKLAGRSYTMEELSKLKPSTRTFWNKSIPAMSAG